MIWCVGASFNGCTAICMIAGAIVSWYACMPMSSRIMGAISFRCMALCFLLCSLTSHASSESDFDLKELRTRYRCKANWHWHGVTCNITDFAIHQGTMYFIRTDQETPPYINVAATSSKYRQLSQFKVITPDQLVALAAGKTGTEKPRIAHIDAAVLWHRWFPNNFFHMFHENLVNVHDRFCRYHNLCTFDPEMVSRRLVLFHDEGVVHRMKQDPAVVAAERCMASRAPVHLVPGKPPYSPELMIVKRMSVGLGGTIYNIHGASEGYPIRYTEMVERNASAALLAYRSYIIDCLVHDEQMGGTMLSEDDADGRRRLQSYLGLPAHHAEEPSRNAAHHTHSLLGMASMRRALLAARNLGRSLGLGRDLGDDLGRNDNQGRSLAQYDDYESSAAEGAEPGGAGGGSSLSEADKWRKLLKGKGEIAGGKPLFTIVQREGQLREFVDVHSAVQEIQAALPTYEVRSVQMKGRTLRSSAEVFGSSSIIIAHAGAAVANMAFMTNGTTYVNVVPHTAPTEHHTPQLMQRFMHPGVNVTVVPYLAAKDDLHMAWERVFRSAVWANMTSDEQSAFKADLTCPERWRPMGFSGEWKECMHNWKLVKIRGIKLKASHLLGLLRKRGLLPPA